MKNHINPPFLGEASPWAESTLNKLSLRQQIGQLIHVAGYSNRGIEHEAHLQEMVQKQGIGGIIFFQGTAKRQAEMTNRLQEMAQVPLAISMDAEWGLGMRLEAAFSFPYQMTLGAMADQETPLIREMGKQIAKQCKRLGVHINFAPCVDVNNNAANPVIGFRSFGEGVQAVTAKALAYMEGMQEEHVLACAKHFPGHGDTAVDSHLALPTIPHERERLMEVELAPFRALVEKGVGAVMSAHLQVPAFETRPNTPSSLSAPIINDLLKKEMGFSGLVFTDALDMKGVAELHPPGVVDVKAFLAGNDVLLFTVDVPRAIEEIEKAVEQGEITEGEIRSRCLKMLQLKSWLGLEQIAPIEVGSIDRDIRQPEAFQLKQRLHDASVTLPRQIDRGKILVDQGGEIAAISMVAGQSLDVLQDTPAALMHHLTVFKEHEGKGGNFFHEQVKKHADAACFQFSDDMEETAFEKLLEEWKEYGSVLLAIHRMEMKASLQFGLSDRAVQFVDKLMALGNVIMIFTGNAYALNRFSNLEKLKGLVLVYQENEEAIKAGLKVTFGKMEAKGTLPVSLEH